MDEYFKFALEDKKTLKAAKNFNKEHGRIRRKKMLCVKRCGIHTELERLEKSEVDNNGGKLS